MRGYRGGNGSGGRKRVEDEDASAPGASEPLALFSPRSPQKPLSALAAFGALTGPAAIITTDASLSLEAAEGDLPSPSQASQASQASLSVAPHEEGCRRLSSAFRVRPDRIAAHLTLAAAQARCSPEYSSSHRRGQSVPGRPLHISTFCRVSVPRRLPAVSALGRANKALPRPPPAPSSLAAATRFLPKGSNGSTTPNRS